MASLKKKVIVRDRHRNYLQEICDGFNALTLTTEIVIEVNLRKYQKTLTEKSELLKSLDNEIIDLIDEEDVDRINSEVDSSVSNFQSMKSPVKQNHLLSKFFCYIT